jgi:glyoxylase-like metal-dependent hydrolase (beta-lactamase superfamily II)
VKPEFVPLAPDARRLPLRRGDMLNAYLLGDVLVDAGVRAGARKVLQALEGERVAAHAITHGHFDHQGASHALCQALGIPLWCGAGEKEAVESGDFTRLLPKPRSLAARVEQLLSGPAHPVARVLRQGDEVGAGFVVLETPGHTPGSISFWREADGVLVLGDAAMNRHPWTGRRGLQEPVGVGTMDRELNRASLRRLAELQPAIVCFGHGEPLTEPMRFRAFVAGLSLPD